MFINQFSRVLSRTKGLQNLNGYLASYSVTNNVSNLTFYKTHLNFRCFDNKALDSFLPIRSLFFCCKAQHNFSIFPTRININGNFGIKQKDLK